MTIPDDDLVTLWITQMAEGDQTAAERIWGEYFEKLVRCARRRLDGAPRRAVDEEDVALSAMQSFCNGLQAGKFEQLGRRDELWRLLVTITARKACAARRQHMAAKRGGGRVRGDSIFCRAGQDDDLPGFAEVLGREPTPELAAEVADLTRNLLDRIDDPRMKQIALLTLEGFGAQEIADQLNCARRTVERKLERIRALWGRELTDSQ